MTEDDMNHIWLLTEAFPSLYWEVVNSIPPPFFVFTGGSGTEDAPFMIETIEQIQEIEYREHIDKHFLQLNDIDASDTKNWNDGKGFLPVGSSRWVSPFSGGYDGNGHAISNLTINREGENYIGLFGHITGRGIVRHLTLDNVSITGYNDLGGLAGSIASINIFDVHVNGIIKGRSNVGGITGRMWGGAIRQVSAQEIEVTGVNYVGGLAVWNSSGIISQSFAAGKVFGSSHVGGLAGFLSLQCYDRCEGMVFSSYALVDITGNQNTGGLIGSSQISLPLFTGMTDAFANSSHNRNHNSHLSSANNGESSPGYFTNEQVSALSYTVNEQEPGSKNFGVVASYSVGKITGADNSGGIIGSNPGLATVQASYWDMISSGCEQGYGASGSQHIDVLVQGLATEQMTGENAYEHMYHLDFEHIWQLTDGYPVLQWQDPENKIPTPENSRIAVEQEDQALVKSIKLHQNYPNPFNPVTVIPFSVAGQTHARLSVYNILGQHVSTLVNEIRSPGWHDVIFDATGLSSGLYVYRLEADGYVKTRSMLIVK